ncbi:MAG: M67 family metallopeptidase [Acidobacteria bacterium]|nr:M67 family metallopeptidase [Acidobacteriota bacterium]
MTSETTLVRRSMVEAMYAHAREESPSECCGEIGGRGVVAESLYPMRNIADDPRVRFEAAHEDLTRAQRLMRERGERLQGIYHSHPAEADPTPSATDIRVAYYTEAVYFIIGFDGAGECVLRAFRIFKEQPFDECGRWERAEFVLTED